jgi:hypothetical protein
MIDTPIVNHAEHPIHLIIERGFFFFFAILVFELRVYNLSHSVSPFFVMGFFEIGSHGTVCPGWL